MSGRGRWLGASWERPLAGEGVLLRFARDLRRLRETAGSPTYRELSGRAHYSAAALSEAANGQKLPSLSVTLAYVAACGGDTDVWHARWKTAHADLGATPAPVPEPGDDDQAPYVGLSAFQPDDADRFFGRDDLIADLLTRIRDRRFLGVFGPSGCGKSSVLRAGLVARRQPAVVLTPGSHPIEECAVSLAAAIGESSAALRAEFAADPKNLHLRIRQALTGKPADLLLVVDQFEEVFTLCHDRDERDWLINALTTAAFARTSRTRVVLGVRADFYGHCGQHPKLVEALRDAQVLVGPMNEDELRLAITEPATRAGYRVETALVAKLITVAANQPGVLPLVSHVLLETWRRRRGITLKLSGYEATGGIKHALTRTAEDVYTGLDGGQQEVAKQIVLRLTALGEGTEDTKRRVLRRELDDNPDTATVLERLALARLVTLDRDSVELAHEALIRHWPRLRDWLIEDRDGHRIHRELTEATDAWESLDRDPGALYRGIRLDRAHTWAATRNGALTAREREFLDTSLSAQARDQAAVLRRARRLRRLVALLVVLVLIATAATIYAIRAQHNAFLFQQALREAAALQTTDFSLAAQLTLAVYRLDPTPEARGGVLGILAQSDNRELRGHSDDVRSVSISRARDILATVGVDHTVRLWDLSDEFRSDQLAWLGTDPDTISSAVIFPDGQTLATSSHDHLVRLWNIPTDRRHPEPLGQLGNQDDLVSLAVSPDGRTLAAASGSGKRIRLWNTSDREHPVLLTTIDGRGGPGFTMAFSPNGRTLVAGSHRDVRQYDLSDRTAPRESAVAFGEIGWVDALAFTPEGGTLAVAFKDNAVRLWEITEHDHPRLLASLDGHGTLVSSAAFSSDGRMLAIADLTGLVRLWNVTDRHRPAELATVTADFGSVLSMAFGPDGHTLVVGDDNVVRLLETDVERAALAICRTPDRPLGQGEWDRYFPGLDYQPPCP